jgi:AGCS family alanine or glycine:cation symporter
MTVYEFFNWLNNDVLALPSTLFFFGVSLILTWKTRGIQVWGLHRFITLLTRGIKTRHDTPGTISSFHALFTAMATTIGMGNVVTPALAIKVGGPGALFWLIFYMLLGSVTKFAEVTFALATRKKLSDGFIQGGPIQYLRSISPFLAYWYGFIIVIVLASWSSAQSNTLANIMALEGVPQWIVGVFLALFVGVVVSGGAQRVGQLASNMVPVMFVLYVVFALSILLRHPYAILDAFKQMFQYAFTPAAAAGGFVGASLFQAVREGIFRGIFITEAGLGTSSIPHALADTKNPTDQGILAMGSVLADSFLAMLSGLLVLMTGIWQSGTFRSTLTYEVFKFNAPGLGQYVLLFSIVLFVVTTVMGNSFNGIQCFGILVKDKKPLMRLYMAFITVFIFIGALIPMKLLWDIIDTLIILAAVPNLVGILCLTFTHPHILQVKK